MVSAGKRPESASQIGTVEYYSKIAIRDYSYIVWPKGTCVYTYIHTTHRHTYTYLLFCSGALLRAHSLSLSPYKFFSSLLAAAAASSSSQHKSAIISGVVRVDDNYGDNDNGDICLIATVVLTYRKQQSQSIDSLRRRYALGLRCFRSLFLRFLLNPQSKFANNQRSYQCCLAMVCKENVVSWFSSLSSYKRIDVMCTLLNMCLPFEIRFFGTVVEDLGKRDYNVLRDTEHRANNVSDLTEFTNLSMTDKRTRRKLALYTALLQSCSHSCAGVLYKILSNLDFQEIQTLVNGTNCSSDEQPLEELLLLYTMAVNHPAFNYEQKSTFGNVLIKLKTEHKNLKDSRSDSLSFKSQNCIPCTNQNDRIDPDILTNIIAPPPMQTFQGEMQLRNNTIIAGIPSGGISLTSPGLCPIPGPEQMSMPPPGHSHYVHVSFPSVQPIQGWPGQMMMGQNQFMYQPSESSVIYSPSGSQQSSPTHSQAHSRSNSPIGHVQQQRKNNSNNNNNASSNGLQQQPPRTSSQITQPTSNILTTSTSTSSTQTTNSTNLGTAMSLPPLSSISTSRNQNIISGQSQIQPLMPPVARPPFSLSGHQQQWQHNNNVETTITTSTVTVTSKQQQQQQPPPPRLKSTHSGESLRESGNKEMPNFKGNFQNTVNNEIKRLSDEDISKSDLTSNALNNMKTQTANGLTQTPEKKIEGSINIHSTNESIENETFYSQITPMDNVVVDNSIVKPSTIPDPAIINYHQPNPASMPNLRRYPHQMDPSHMPLFPPHTMYHTQNPCYQCNPAGFPLNIQNRYARNPTTLYCVTNQLQALRLDPENNRNSQSSSSDSTGSRSPPETPPALQWMGNELNSTPVSTVVEQQQQPHMTNVPPPLHSIPASQERRPSRKNQSHLMRQKSHSSNMVNGVVPPPQQPQQQAPQQQQQHQQVQSTAVTGFQVPPPGYVPHHFTGLRPATTGIYSNFTPAYARPGYPIAATTYQHNGEMMYQYSTHPPPPGSTAPPPSPSAAVQTSQPPPQQTQPNFSQPPPPLPVTYASVSVPPPHIPPKTSCYNCGSTMHLAADCIEQTMEDITRRASYRLDYTTTKPTAGSGDQQNQSSDK
ncbi:proline-rich protein 36-like isoform X2 [Phymastichus coffea]|uniref:proline-rich protein 36-like isoform X2 n=1 Tax=Phymastichus coffea TaxID=108790 RepID=UPI00273AC99A|nr:proline-rich protein 36-like isoform X2 [Phymastichus coffea]